MIVYTYILYILKNYNVSAECHVIDMKPLSAPSGVHEYSCTLGTIIIQQSWWCILWFQYKSSLHIRTHSQGHSHNYLPHMYTCIHCNDMEHPSTVIVSAWDSL